MMLLARAPARRAIAACAAAGAALWPAWAWACPVCGQAPERAQKAYLAMTVVMSLLPLAVMGAIAWWLYRRIRRAEAENELLRLSSPLPSRSYEAPRAFEAARTFDAARAARALDGALAERTIPVDPGSVDTAKNLH